MGVKVNQSSILSLAGPLTFFLFNVDSLPLVKNEESKAGNNPREETLDKKQ